MALMVLGLVLICLPGRLKTPWRQSPRDDQQPFSTFSFAALCLVLARRIAHLDMDAFFRLRGACCATRSCRVCRW